MQVEKYVFQPHGDERGQLVALEEFKDIPFSIKRVCYIYNTADMIILGYCKEKLLHQVLICVHGSCKIRLDNGFEKEVVALDKPNEGVIVANDVWREIFDFSSDAVIMVLASELYDDTDFTKDYDEYLNFVQSSSKDE